MQGFAKIMAIMSCFSTAQVMALSCGDVISSNTTLNDDLLNCPVNGLTIAADGVTLDLNGHTIDGSGSGNGITVMPGVNKVNIIGEGTVKDFYTGIVISGGVKHSLNNIRIWGTQQGAYFLDMSQSVVQQLDIIGGLNGIILDGDSNDNEVIDNDVTAVVSEGIWIRKGSYNILSGNYLLNNETGVVFNGGLKNVFKYNHVIGNANGVLIGPGISSSGDSIKHTVYQNKIYNNHTGIWLNSYATSNQVVEITIQKNAVFGGAHGLYIDGPNNVDNDVINNYFADQSVYPIQDIGTSTQLLGNQCNGVAC
ncbi:NosD domain-containing protein [Pseudoteredinibacter isoporae]|uniref:NosD domain-containing protein n=1 Tax=Pseudoteredinibacter isoporae TaxID=570281 RepID=UPI003103C1F0